MNIEAEFTDNFVLARTENITYAKIAKKELHSYTNSTQQWYQTRIAALLLNKPLYNLGFSTTMSCSCLGAFRLTCGTFHVHNSEVFDQ